ncbi:ABC transporter ATP-binding protein [Bacillus licheniformis]|jgi:peptide/nickel transport system ATP-binding protein|uniref:Oligopeptide transport ATP-binding protein OppD n=3 Tax=Bacillus paralicheniformis TaxID=1648923 RepID=A0A6I7TL46_9BACI|nr:MULTISPECIES: ABC transporter ATP-binding protein [Bacillus]ETB70922.1 peptide ABC transporter ATP-binding protein [Bacillus sp. CPSM8]KJD52547.1 peptide ABC transporter ATP-binding protein [Bacillus amyloliquefaciens]KUL09671.1 peptide ABC transporter ATP-binding protein [Bacillus licheniformis LMG 7559]KUL17264.1 peptide ABC transporter ATP-binding protein [Bacillus licheniformis LMG 6934]MBC8622111.1 ABC transporter ATP-binding protein [Robertmurraya crescens]MBY8349714.1 ABC transporte
MSALLEVNDLKTYFFRKKQPIPAVDGVDFSIKKGETVALVGESGSGKSITSLSIMGLVEGSGGKIMNGSIKLEGRDLVTYKEQDLCKIRGNEISMIFQEPMTSLNPVLTIGEQITEVLIYHKKLSKKEAAKKAVELLKLVGFSRAGELMKEYPHRLSGGMRQRVMIAIALSCNPKLLIADEPTTALDVTIQAQVLELMKDLCDKFDTSILLITHDLGVVSEIADRVIVMYCGQVVENATVDELFDEPLHPYTKGLLNSIPVIEGSIEKLTAIKGNVPTPDNLPAGCRFAPRCPSAGDKCWGAQPDLKTRPDGRSVRCFLYEEGE